MKFIHDAYIPGYYGFRDWTFYNTEHLGRDLVSNYDVLYAPCDGFITAAPYGEEGGQWLHLEEAGTYMCEYFGVEKIIHRFAHLSVVESHNPVKEGDRIGVSGNSGEYTTNPHTHWDISKNKLDINDIDNFIDPDLYYKVKLRYMDKYTGKQIPWFVEEGWYDKAKEAGVKSVDEPHDIEWFELLTANMKYTDSKKKA
jgi:hypothetical protein